MTVRKLLLSTLTAVFFATAAACGADAKEVKVLIITGDEVGAHKWKETAPFMKDVLTKAGHKVDITETPAKDLTPDNLAKYDVLLLNYRNTPQGAKENPASVWSDDNKKAFLDAIKGGKGRVVDNVLGHDVEAMKSSEGFRALLIRGVEWAGTGESFYKLPDSLKGEK